MPNFCENELTISGPDVERVLAAIANPDSDEPDQRILDFDKIVPYPQVYKDLDRRSAEYRLAFMEIAMDDPLRNEKLKALADKYGVEPGTTWIKDGYNAGGYEWCIQNWSTKWNACRVALTKRPASAPLPECIACAHCAMSHKTATLEVLACPRCGAPLPDTRPLVAFIEFETAWSPPEAVIEKLASMFSDHTFDLAYYEGGVGFCGQARWSGGREEFHHQSDYSGPRGG